MGDDMISAAAQHLLSAASPDNDDPTSSLLAGALALSHAGVWVTWTETLHDSRQVVRTMRGDLTKATITARSDERVDGAVWIAFSDELRDHVYTDAEALTIALYSLLDGEDQPNGRAARWVTLLRAVMRGAEVDLATVGVKGIVQIQPNGATTMTLRAPGVEAAAMVDYQELELMRIPSAPPWSLSLWTRGERPANAEYMDADDLACVLARWAAGSADPIQETP